MATTGQVRNVPLVRPQQPNSGTRRPKSHRAPRRTERVNRGNRTFILVSFVLAVGAGTFLGYVAGYVHEHKTQAQIESEAFDKFRGYEVPGTDEEAVYQYTGDGELQSFTPSDAALLSLPNGTVCYEVYDKACNRRYWVLRWPENGGYSIVPRDEVTYDGKLVPYNPNYKRIGDTAEEVQ